MTRTEEQLSELLHQAAPDVSEVNFDLVGRRVQRRHRLALVASLTTVVVLVAGITVAAAALRGSAGRPQGLTGSPRPTGARSSWRTYHQPTGPMHLTFKYPTGWTATGSTFMASMGNVGVAYLEHNASALLKAVQPGHEESCRARAAVAGGSGVFIEWSANIGAPAPMRLSEVPGKHLTIHGWPARLQSTTVPSICAGSQELNVSERLIIGVIQEGPHTFQRMTAEIGKKADAHTLARVDKIFESTRR